MRRTPLPLSIAAVFCAAVVATAHPEPAAAASCSDYSTQADAQRAADTVDGDGDGRYCESLPCPCASEAAPPVPGQRAPPAPAGDPVRARVERVVDGDTIDVNAGGRQVRVRLVGIDTPEVYGGVECGGREASASLKTLAPAGRRVTLRTDPTQARTDRYGRLLAYADLGGGRSLQSEQLRRGWASVYIFAGTPFARTTAFRRIERAARRASRGMWGLCPGVGSARR